MSAPSYVGIDLGGTNVRAAVVGPDGSLSQHRHERVDHSSGPAGVIESIVAIVTSLLDHDTALAGIGLAVSGPVDIVTGVVANPWTLPGWNHVNVRAPLEERFAVRVVIENDAAAAALGEYWCGAGAGSHCMVMVTVGTGIGVALVKDEGLLRGSGNRHPEPGHHSIAGDGPRCACGVVGCWEQLASGSALERMAGEAIEQRRWTPTHRPTSAKEIADLAEAGDGEAQRLVAATAYYLGQGIRNLEAFYAPDRIVIGGGLGARFDLLVGALEDGRSPASALNPRADVRPAALGELAGVVGIGLAARDGIAAGAGAA